MIGSRCGTLSDRSTRSGKQARLRNRHRRAGLLDETKKPGQRVQAVYLGQTDRFSSRFPERNQISEVWQIVPKTN